MLEHQTRADKEKMSTLDEYCATGINALQAANRLRQLMPSAREGIYITQGNTRYISFSCNDYLGLSQHPKVTEAAIAALKEYGAGAGASRLVTGNHPFYAPLEAQIAEMKATEAALVFGSGYLTNLGVIPALVGKGDVVFADKLVHACLLDGAQLSGAKLVRFRHNDVTHLEALMQEHRAGHKHALVLVDHVYSMDGDVAPLAAISALAKTHNAWLLADDAHGLGILKPEGKVQVDVWMGTLSKAVGGYGGYIAASQKIISYLTSMARSVIFSTGLPPATCAAALAALECIQAQPALAKRALSHANQVCNVLGLPPTKSTIVPVMLGDETKALAVSAALKKHGILATAIRPPTVPSGTSRLRLTFSALHSDADIDHLIAALREEGVTAHG